MDRALDIHLSLSIQIKLFLCALLFFLGAGAEKESMYCKGVFCYIGLIFSMMVNWNLKDDFDW